MNRKLILIITKYTFLICAVCALASCGHTKEEPTPPAETAERTVLVYIAAKNNLGYGYSDYDENGKPIWVHAADSLDLDEMRQAVRNGALGSNDNLVIYHRDCTGKASLVRMNSSAKTDTLVRYDSTDGMTSVHAERMSRVIADAKKYCPANNYGLVLWSHGDGWLQNGLSETPATSQKAWGQENGKKMNITTLASVLDGQGFDYIYFDCCYMATVETVYELRNCTSTIVACPSELPREGTPWHKVLKYLFGNVDLKAAAQTTFNHYNAMSGDTRTCTISVIKTAALVNLAEATARVFDASTNAWPTGYQPQAFSLSSPCYYYDLAQYIDAICLDSTLLEQWHTILNQVVEYTAATPKLWNVLPIKYNCGLTTYILRDENYTTQKNYNTLSWYDDVTSHLFN